jgi:hypothetical protein
VWFRRQHTVNRTHTKHTTHNTQHTTHNTVVLFWDEPFLLTVGVVQLLELLVLYVGKESSVSWSLRVNV